MPEGPEVTIVRNFMEKQIKNKYILGIFIDRNSKFVSNGIPGMNYFEGPVKVLDVTNKGKYIFIQIYNEKTEEIYYIYNHLNMEGKWILERGAHSNLWMIIGDNKNKNNIFEKTFELFFNDTRKFGKFEIITVDEYNNKITKDIGPDLLNEVVTWEQYYNKFKDITSRTRTMDIAAFLLQQKYFSGIGNYLKSEVLYHARINPFRKLSTLTDNEIYNVYTKSLQLIKLAYYQGGMTIKSFVNPFNNNNGGFRPSVYGQLHDPNGYTVVISEQKDRSTHWVEELQI